jgi:DNA-binding protein H-NS
MATLQELLAQKHALERQILEAQRSRHTEALAQIRQIMAEHGLTVVDITAQPSSRKAAQASRGKVAAKYKHPQTGASWTGRGLKPRWLSEELSNGKTLADFAI